MGGRSWLAVLLVLHLPACLAQPDGLPDGIQVVQMDVQAPPRRAMHQMMQFSSGPDNMVIELPGSFGINDARPMGMNDISAVFPFAGPFGSSDDGVPGDRFMTQTLDEVDRTFLNQLLPVMQARWPTEEHPCDQDVRKLCPHADDPLHCLGLKADKMSKPCTDEIRHTVPFVCSSEIHDLCDDGLDKGVLDCLDKHGPQLDPDCHDAVVAVRHALSSLKVARQDAERGLSFAGNGKKSKAAKKKYNAGSECPARWEPSSDGCCTRRWSPSYGAARSAIECNNARTSKGKWEFKWADFRTHPYICCPKPASGKKRIGGEPICPSGWDMDKTGKMEFCCRKAWKWSCGQHCAEEQCVRSEGLKWVSVNFKKEHYACCPDGYVQKSAPSAAAADRGSASQEGGIPDAPGESWVSKPLDLTGWTGIGLVAVVVVLVVACVRHLGSDGGVEYGHGRRGPKDL